MIFSDLYKSPRSTLTKFRNSFPHGPAPLPADVDADLVSRDKARNKEAVRKFLSEKIRNDWDFTWPALGVPAPTPADAVAPAQEEATLASTTTPATVDDDAPRDPGEEADSESDAESVYSTISEDAQHFRPRADWTSDLSDDEPIPPASPFRFDSPDAVGAAILNSAETKRARRRRAVRDEAKWNPGLACFEARRNAWTGAKTVRVKPKPASPASPSSGRRLFWRHHRTQSSVSHTGILTSGSPPAAAPSPLQARTSTTTASESDASAVQRTTSQDSTPPSTTTATSPHYPVHTLLPLPSPLLPPQNPMRASIQPSMYGSLYDKVVAQSLQPSCPVNLGDMLRACVVGWKRDGEWPPRPMYAAPAPLQMHHHQEAVALRQRKAQAQQQQKARGAEQGTAAGRRLSLVGFFGGTSTVAALPAPAPVPAKAAPAQPQEGKENAQSQSHSDEGGAGSSGKALFRRSLQRVFSLGQHGHGQQQQAQTQTQAGSGGGAAGEVAAAV